MSTEAQDTLRRCPVGTKIQSLVFDRAEFTEQRAAAWAKSHGFVAPYVDVKPETIRIRQHEPGEFVEGSLRTIHLGRPGVKAIVGCPKTGAREEEAKESAKDPAYRPAHVTHYVHYAPLAPRGQRYIVMYHVVPDKGGTHHVQSRHATKAAAQREADSLNSKGAREDHVHAIPTSPEGTTGGAIEVKDDPSCGCAPQPSPPRSAAYDACLAEGAKLGPIKTPERVYQLVGATMSKQEQETLVVIPLDARYQLRGAPVEVHRGARSSVAVSTQEVLRTVIVSGASSFIMCHSHPSGRCSPSQADRDLTKHVDKACKTVGGECLMLDHVVIGRREYFSIREDKLYKVKST